MLLDYRRLQRFFQHIKIDYNVIAMFIFRLFEFDKRKFFLTMDSTKNSSGSKTDIARLFHGVKQGKKIVLPDKRIVCENKLYISDTLIFVGK